MVNEGLNVINEDNTYSKLFTYNGGNQPNTYKLKSNPHSILKNLKKEPKSVLNLQIETLLINTLYVLYNPNNKSLDQHPDGYGYKRNGDAREITPNPYSCILVEFPEYAPYEWIDKNGNVLKKINLMNSDADSKPLNIINESVSENDPIPYYRELRSGTRFIKQDTSDDQYKVISVSYDNESFVKNNYVEIVNR